MSRPCERGAALVAAVGALAVTSVLAVGLAYTTVVDQQLTENTLAALQAQALARSGVAVATVLLRDAAVADDTLRAPWAQDSGRQPLGAGWVEVHIEDEARRLDLNVPELHDAAGRLFVLLGLDPGLADALADWTDADDLPRPRGAERGEYLALRPPRVPPNAPLASVEELRLVRGFDERAVERLRPHVTVAGEPRVNPNTASREVLTAVLGDAAAARLLAAREREAVAADGPLLTARGQHYTVRVIAAVGDVRCGVAATLWAPAESEPEIVAWRPFVPEEPASAPGRHGGG